eukprot:4511978-Amphidinium_carterae.1
MLTNYKTDNYMQNDAMASTTSTTTADKKTMCLKIYDATERHIRHSMSHTTTHQQRHHILEINDVRHRPMHDRTQTVNNSGNTTAWNTASISRAPT